MNRRIVQIRILDNWHYESKIAVKEKNLLFKHRMPEVELSETKLLKTPNAIL